MENQLINGDCIGVMKKLPNECVDLICTDPPYLISYKTNRRKDKEHEFTKEIANDSNPDLIKEYVKECYRILKNNSAMYMFCSADKVDFFKQELEKHFTIKNMIIWVKNNWTAGDLEAAFGRQYEIAFLVNKGRKKFNGKRITDVWFFDRVVGKEQVHQNQKPLDLIKQCIEKHSSPGDLVFDGFSGSGTTLCAAKELGRKYLCVELKKEYCDIIKERANLSGFETYNSVDNTEEYNTKEIEKIWSSKIEIKEEPNKKTLKEDDGLCSVCGATYSSSYEEHIKRPFHQSYT